MKKIIIFLIFFFIVFFISGEKLAEFDNVYKPGRFQVSGDGLYIVDGYQIKLFSMKNFKLITRFGKKGEGPGEFKFAPKVLLVFPDQAFVSCWGKVALFTRKGKLIKEKKSPNFTDMYKVKENYLGRIFKYDRKNDTSEFSMLLFDKDLNKQKVLSTYIQRREEWTGYQKGMSKKMNINMFKDYFDLVTDGEFIFIGDTKKGFFIDIFDSKGERVNTIKNGYEKLKTSKENIEEYWKRSKRPRDEKRANYIYPEYYPAYKKLFVNNKKIYAITYKFKRDKQELLILDMKGKILKQTYIPEKRYYNFFNNKYYYFVDNEAEEVMEFHAVDL
ncbi:MAG: hypothetical protein ABFR75_08075 [Acidobacteriota bacterium]